MMNALKTENKLGFTNDVLGKLATDLAEASSGICYAYCGRNDHRVL